MFTKAVVEKNWQENQEEKRHLLRERLARNPGRKEGVHVYESTPYENTWQKKPGRKRDLCSQIFLENTWQENQEENSSFQIENLKTNRNKSIYG